MPNNRMGMTRTDSSSKNPKAKPVTVLDPKGYVDTVNANKNPGDLDYKAPLPRKQK